MAGKKKREANHPDWPFILSAVLEVLQTYDARPSAGLEGDVFFGFSVEDEESLGDLIIRIYPDGEVRFSTTDFIDDRVSWGLKGIQAQFKIKEGW